MKNVFLFNSEIPHLKGSKPNVSLFEWNVLVVYKSWTHIWTLHCINLKKPNNVRRFSFGNKESITCEFTTIWASAWQNLLFSANGTVTSLTLSKLSTYVKCPSNWDANINYTELIHQTAKIAIVTLLSFNFAFDLWRVSFTAVLSTFECLEYCHGWTVTTVIRIEVGHWQYLVTSQGVFATLVKFQ